MAADGCRIGIVRRLLYASFRALYFRENACHELCCEVWRRTGIKAEPPISCPPRRFLLRHGTWREPIIQLALFRRKRNAPVEN
jgi:hypothetical protein